MDKSHSNEAKKNSDVKGIKPSIEKKEKVVVGMTKKQLIAVVVIIIVTISGISGGVIIYANMPKGGDFILGVIWGPDYGIDPLDGGIPSSNNVIYQVAEGLFDYDLISEDSRIIPNLATT